jgi:hypothetical protein
MTHEHREHSTDWYWGLGVAAVGGAAVAIFFGNVLFAIILVLGAGCIGYLAARGPREHSIKIDDHGVSVDGTRYPYSAVRSFWVEHDQDNPRLFLSMRGALSPHFSLTLDSAEQGAQVRSHLQRFVQEREQGPHAGERLAQLFGL